MASDLKLNNMKMNRTDNEAMVHIERARRLVHRRTAAHQRDAIPGLVAATFR